MWWALPLVMGGLGGMSAEKKKDAEIENNKLQAELTKYAPWTGQWGKIAPVSGGFMDGAMKGAISGLSMNQSLGAAGFDMGGAGGGEAGVMVAGSEAPNATGWSTLEGSRFLEMPEMGRPYYQSPRYF